MVGIDIIIERVRSHFENNLWTDKNCEFYGRVYPNVKGNDNGILPEIYDSTTAEYKEVLLDDKLDCIAFFYVNPNRGLYFANVSIIFAVNVKNIYSGYSTRETERAMRDAKLELYHSGAALKIDETSGIITGIDAVDEFTFTNSNKMDTHPFYLFRFECEANYNFNAPCDYKANKYVLTISSDDETQGLTLPVIGANTYKENTNVTIYPVPKSGYEWLKWQIGGVDNTTENPTITMNSNKVAKAFFQAIVENYYQDVIQGVEDEIIWDEDLGIYKYPNYGIGDEDLSLTIKGSNYIKYVSADQQYSTFKDVYIEDGDIVTFTARLDAATNSYILGSDTSVVPQIRFISSGTQLSINVGGSTIYYPIGNSTNWQDYSVHFDISNNLIGVKVNDGSFLYKASSIWTGIVNPINTIGKTAGAFSDISIYNFVWKNSENVSKANLPLCEGAFSPYNIIEENLISNENSGIYYNDTSLIPINIVRGFSSYDLDVIIIAGQSNGIIDITGHGSEGFSGDYLKSQPHLYSFKIDGGDSTILTQLNTYDGENGACELSMGMKLTENNKRVLFIKGAWGSTDLATFWQKGGAAYDALLSVFNETKLALTAIGINLKIRDFLWYQGEQDALNETKATNYQPNFNTMWGNMLTDGIVEENTKLVMHYISGDVFPYQSEVNAAFDAIAIEKGGVVIQTSDASKSADNVHYDTAGAILLGERDADVYLAEDYPLVQGIGTHLIPALENGTSDVNGNPLTYTQLCGFPNADSVLNEPDDAELNTVFAGYSELNGMANPNDINFTYLKGIDTTEIPESKFQIDNNGNCIKEIKILLQN